VVVGDQCGYHPSRVTPLGDFLQGV
jgi:hypothetical protein